MSTLFLFRTKKFFATLNDKTKGIILLMGFNFHVFFGIGQIDGSSIARLSEILKSNPEEYSIEFLLLENQFTAQKSKSLLYQLYDVHSDHLMKRDDYDSAISILHKMLELSENDEEYSQTCLIMASAHYFKGNYDSLVYWQNRVEKLIKPNTVLYGKNLLVSGYRSAFDGSYSNAIEKTLEAIKIFEKFSDQQSLALAYQSLAIDYFRLGNNEKQNYYLLKAIEINKKLGNTYALIQNYNNLGVNYKKQDLLKDAMIYYDLAYQELKKVDSPFLLAQNLTNRGNILEKLGEYDRAEQLFLECERVSEVNNILYGVMISNLNLGNLYRIQKRYDQSAEKLEQALKFSIDLKRKLEEALAYERMSRLARDRNDYKSAFEYQSLFHNLNDSLVNESVKKEAMELSEKYEAEKKENQIISLSKDKLNQKYIIFLLATSFLGILVLFQRWRNRIRLNQKEEEREKQELKHKMETVEKELLADSLKRISVMTTKKSIRKELKDILKDFPTNSKARIMSLIKELESSHDESIIDEFENRFMGVYDDFFKKLKAISSDLTPTELRIAALIRLNFTSKEIATLINRNVGTIDNLRSSIRKKLQLVEDINLVQKLMEL